MTEKPLHAGHRQRLTKKILLNSETLPDHELLEALLFSVLPRQNTNPLAHLLIRTFGSLKGVFEASAEQLMAVDGVGEKVTRHLVVIGQIYKRTNETSNDYSRETEWNTFENVRNKVVDFFNGLGEEQLLVVFLNDKYRKITELVFSDRKENSVVADIPEIVKMFSIHNPDFVIISHNHPFGTVEPSEEDDYTTKKLHMLCEIHGVTLIDHVIVNGCKTYSYKTEGRLDYIRDIADINKILKNVERSK